MRPDDPGGVSGREIAEARPVRPLEDLRRPSSLSKWYAPRLGIEGGTQVPYILGYPGGGRKDMEAVRCVWGHGVWSSLLARETLRVFSVHHTYFQMEVLPWQLP